MRPRYFCVAVWFLFLAVSAATAQQSSPAPASSETAARADFLQAADEVMADMSKILSLPVREPLKKSVR
jgi:hypothetical protein